MSSSRCLWLVYTSPQSVEFAHQIRRKSGIDVRLLMRLPLANLEDANEKPTSGTPTPAELTMLNVLALGVEHKQAAETLRMSIRSLNLRIEALREKLGVQIGRAHA